MNQIDRRANERYLANLPSLLAKLTESELQEYHSFKEKSNCLIKETLEGEHWVPLNDSNGLYSISSYARIRRNSPIPYISARGLLRKGRPENILKKRKEKGYDFTMISVYGKTKLFGIHRQFAIHFIENPKNLPYINHLNGIRDDNRPCNLEWCNNSMNQLHAYRVNGRSNPRSFLGKTGALCPNSKQVGQYDMDGNLIKVWAAASEAGRVLGTWQSCISLAAKKGSTSLGYKWKYL